MTGLKKVHRRGAEDAEKREVAQFCGERPRIDRLFFGSSDESCRT
jgi:hypothetical protein